MSDNPFTPPAGEINQSGDGRDVAEGTPRWRKVCLVVSLLIAVGYGWLYWRHSVGISPFHISRRLPMVDWLVLAITVVLPLLVGIACGFLSGRGKWYVLSLYPVVIALSLF